MSYVQFKRIYGKKYNSFEAFDLPIVPGRHLVIGDNLSTGGSNGSGKSSMFENLSWTRYKKYLRGTDPSFHGRGDCQTGFECNIDSIEYRVERYFKHPKNGNSIQLFCNGEDISNRLSSGVEAEIERLIPIPYDLFVSTCVVAQGLPVNFSQFTPTIRKTIIEEAIGFSVWDAYRKKFGKKLTSISQVKSGEELNYNKLDRELVSLNSKIESLAQSLEGKNEKLAAEKDAIKADLISFRDRIESETALCKSQFGEKTTQEIRADIDKINQAFMKIRTRISDLLIIIKEEICPTCKTPYPEDKMSGAKAEHKDLAPQADKLQEDLSKARADMSRLESYTQTIRDFNTSMQYKKQQLARINSQIASQGESDNKEIEEVKTKIQNTIDAINVAQEAINEYTRDIEHLNFIDKALVPSSSFRTQLLAKYLGHITGILKGITPSVFNDTQVSLVVDEKATGVHIEILRSGKPIEYKQMSGGERRRLDIIIILAFQRFLMEASGVRTNLVVFDEPFENLDSNGVESVLNAMDILFPEDMAVYVISHNDALKSRFQSVIRVVKEDGVSRVVL
jgi:DNA repair exonuclease SbcCD ATPase subunit